MIKTVQDLIDELEKVENKASSIQLWSSNGSEGIIYKITEIDEDFAEDYNIVEINISIVGNAI